MTTLKAIAKNTEIGNYSLVIRDEDGIVKTVLAQNVDINTATAIESYFDFEKLGDIDYLAWICADKTGRWFKDVDKYGEGSWHKISA